MRFGSFSILVTDVKLCHLQFDPVVMASHASLTDRSTGLTIRGIGPSKVAQTQHTVDTTCHAV